MNPFRSERPRVLFFGWLGGYSILLRIVSFLFRVNSRVPWAEKLARSAFVTVDSCEIQMMKCSLGLAFLVLAISSARGQSIEIVSPSHAYTYAYGDALSHQIERSQIANEMIAQVTFSNYPFAGDHEQRRDEMFDFVFPGLHFDAARNEFFARTCRNARIPVAALQPNFPYAGYKLEPTARIFLVKRSGHVTAVLKVTVQPRPGARWVQIDDNWSLQNLLALGFERLTR